MNLQVKEMKKENTFLPVASSNKKKLCSRQFEWNVKPDAAVLLRTARAFDRKRTRN